jgi:hypothetical protein
MVGYTPVATLAIMRLAPAVSFAINASVFPVEAMVKFDELKPEHYRLFNIHSVLAPPIAGAPAFLTPVAEFGRFRVLDAPGNGYFGVVDVPAAATINRDNIDDTLLPWLQSDWLAKDQYVRLDFEGHADLPRFAPGAPAPAPSTPAGTVAAERQTGQVYEADLDVARPAYALFRMTYHFNWKAYIDGQVRQAVMLTPGYLGVAVPAGKHHILCRYEPGNAKLWMAAAGSLLTLLLIGGERLLH